MHNLRLFLPSAGPFVCLGPFHSIFFLKTLIFAFEANNATSQNCLFFGFYPTVHYSTDITDFLCWCCDAQNPSKHVIQTVVNSQEQAHIYIVMWKMYLVKSWIMIMNLRFNAMLYVDVFHNYKFNEIRDFTNLPKVSTCRCCCCSVKISDRISFINMPRQLLCMTRTKSNFFSPKKHW